MSRLSEIISHDPKTVQRAKIEWTNTWISDADHPEKKRILIIGDSVMRQVRGNLESQLGLPVDYIGSSSMLNDRLFLGILDYFFDNTPEYRYEAVFVQHSNNYPPNTGKRIL